MPAPESQAQTSPFVVSYKGLVPDSELLDWVQDGAVSGLVLFRDNCADESALSEALAAIRSRARHTFSVMIDEEGGRVRRLIDAPESMRDLREYESSPLHEVAEQYAAVARRLKRLGIDTLLAPVVDIGDPDAAWLNSRTISHDASRVSAMAASVIPAIQSVGIHACAKHFPGTGRVLLDPHNGPVYCGITRDEWESHEKIPFVASVHAGVHAVLVGHQIMRGVSSNTPACFDRDIVTGWLKSELGFASLALTDDLSMGAVAAMYPIEDAVRMAIDAGCDRVLICNVRETQRRAVEFWARREAFA